MKRFTLAFFAVFMAVLITFTAVLINNKTEFYQDITLNTPAGRVYVAGIFINFAGRSYPAFDGNQTRTEKYIGFFVGSVTVDVAQTICTWNDIFSGYEYTVYNAEFMIGPDGENGYLNIEFSL